MLACRRKIAKFEYLLFPNKKYDMVLCVSVVHVYIICIMTLRLIYGTLTDMAINILACRRKIAKFEYLLFPNKKYDMV
mgnify:CR=1 FL=1